MNSHRNGKIARLPLQVREELNHLLTNNKPGPEILAWLHDQPDTKKILDQYFDGNAITQQNLSEWRHGGYKEWVKLQEKRQFTRELIEHSDAMDSDFTPERITRAFATVAAADFVQDAQERRADCKNSKQRWECSCEIQNQLARRRRDECRLAHLKLRQERWDHELAADQQAAEKATATEERRQMLAWFKLQPQIQEDAQKRGGSDQARDLSALILELEHNLKMGFLDRQSQEFALAEAELEELKQSYRNLRATDSETQPPEGRVSVPIIGQDPNAPTTPVASLVPSAPANNLRSTQHAVPPPTTAGASLPPDSITTRFTATIPNPPPTRPTCIEPASLNPSQSTPLQVEPASTN